MLDQLLLDFEETFAFELTLMKFASQIYQKIGVFVLFGDNEKEGLIDYHTAIQF